MKFITTFSLRTSDSSVLVLSKCLYALCSLLITLFNKMSDCSPHNLTKRGSVLVQPLGIEPSSTVLQTSAMTTSAKVACLVRETGLEPVILSAADFKSAMYTIPSLSHIHWGVRWGTIPYYRFHRAMCRPLHY